MRNYFLCLLLIFACSASSCDEQLPLDQAAKLNQDPSMTTPQESEDGSIYVGISAELGGTLLTSMSSIDDPVWRKLKVEVPPGAFPADGVLNARKMTDIDNALIKAKLDAASMKAEGTAVLIGATVKTLSAPIAVSLGTRAVALTLNQTSNMALISVYTKNENELWLKMEPVASEPIDGIYTVDSSNLGLFQLVSVEEPVTEKEIKLYDFPEGQDPSDLLKVLASLFGVSAGVPPGTLNICSSWSEPTKVGVLDSAIHEASGVAISTKYKDRMYHVNDSDQGNYFYVTSLDGKLAKRVEVLGVTFADTEDLDLGPCPGDRKKSCLYIADTGDNFAGRGSYNIYIIEETDSFGESVTPAKTVTFVYPNHKIDTEGFAVHSNGDAFLLRKPVSLEGDLPYYLSDFYRITAAQLKSATDSPITAAHIGAIDLLYVANGLNYAKSIFDPNLFKSETPNFKTINTDPTSPDASYLLSKVPTSLDIAPDGKSFVVLTYLDAIHFDLDLATITDAFPWTGHQVPGKNYIPIALLPLAQQEAVTFSADGQSLFYTSEVVEGRERSGHIMQLSCQDPKE